MEDGEVADANFFDPQLMRYCAIVLVGLLLGHTAFAAEDVGRLAGRVTKVVDGDTIDVLLDSGLIRVRLHGVDAPEKSQAHGKVATEELTR